ncbi:MAG: hypothetical protein K5675_08960 [Lachnospiraceae bacterium]|nr:hypothetical protein [Lachnospiraceae bacterium]
MSNRRDLINSLAQEFGQVQDPDLVISKSNYIDSTKTLECSATALSKATLQKTIHVVDQHIKKFTEYHNPEKAQYVAHLIVAKKCIEEVMRNVEE